MKIPLIVLEGPDAAGKTTLAAGLCSAFGMTRFHCTWTPGLASGMEDYQRNVLDNIEFNHEVLKQGTVLDRHWPSELVYGSHFREITDKHLDAMEMHARRIAKLGGIYIFCCSDVAAQVRRHEKNKSNEHPYNSADYCKVLSNYYLWFADMCDARIGVRRYSIEQHGSQLSRYYHDLASDYESQSYGLNAQPAVSLAALKAMRDRLRQ